MRTCSPLFSLAVCGVGAVAVESLTSYIRRLAFAHVVSPSTLLRALVLRPLREERGQRDLLLEPTRATESVNGASQAARALASALVRLTGVAEIQGTTLVGLDDAIEFRGAFRKVRAWCPVCLQDSAREVYDRLLWSFSAAKFCVEHRVALVDRCGLCGRGHRPLDYQATPSACPHCGALLGAAARPPRGGIDSATLALGELIGRHQGGTSLRRDEVRDLVRILTQRCGGLAELSAVAGISKAELSSIRSGRVRAGLATFLRLAAVLQHPKRERPAECQKAELPGRTPEERQERMRRAEAGMRAALSEPDAVPLSLRGLGRLYGIDVARLRKRMPDLAAELVRRRKDIERRRRNQREAAEARQVQSAVAVLVESGRSPTKRAVARLLAREGMLRAPHVRSALRTAGLAPSETGGPVSGGPSAVFAGLALDAEPPRARVCMASSVDGLGGTAMACRGG